MRLRKQGSIQTRQVGNPSDDPDVWMEEVSSIPATPGFHVIEPDAITGLLGAAIDTDQCGYRAVIAWIIESNYKPKPITSVGLIPAGFLLTPAGRIEEFNDEKDYHLRHWNSFSEMLASLRAEEDEMVKSLKTKRTAFAK